MSFLIFNNLSSKKLKKIILNAGIWKDGHFIFADGGHGLIKLEMDELWNHGVELEIILQLLAQAEGLPRADVILGVPTGGQRLAKTIGKKHFTIPLVRLERVPGGKKQDYRFCTIKDKELALSARSLRIYEDVVSTLSSIAGVVRLLNPKAQTIHSLAIWRRGKVNEKYKSGVTDHYLIEEEIPIYTQRECPYCTKSVFV